MSEEKNCSRCNSIQVITQPKKFSDGTIHLRKTCATCGQFLGWQKQGVNSFKDEMLYLVKDLASSISGSDYADLKYRAQQLMYKIDTPR